jgi:hypothetical protein
MKIATETSTAASASLASRRFADPVDKNIRRPVIDIFGMMRLEYPLQGIETPFPQNEISENGHIKGAELISMKPSATRTITVFAGVVRFD